MNSEQYQKETSILYPDMHQTRKIPCHLCLMFVPFHKLVDNGVMVCGEFDDTQIFVSFEHKRNCTHLFDMTDPPQTTHICQSEDIYAVTGSPSLLTPF